MLRLQRSVAVLPLLWMASCEAQHGFGKESTRSTAENLVTVGPTVSLSGTTISRVLLLSVDGLHTMDLYKWIAANPRSNMANLAQHGVSYVNALAPTPSNGFPAMLAIATGGTPKTTGVYYDDSYDRTLFAPGSNCLGTAGTEVVYTGAIDADFTKLFTTINAANLPLALNSSTKSCTAVLPHQFLKTNTIFELVEAIPARTAWADSHPSYEILAGPSGQGVSDLYTPEVSSLISNGGTIGEVALADSLASCDGVTNSIPTPTDYTTCVPAALAYDSLKVQALINEIDGTDSSGAKTEPVPTLFGMNFETVGVAQTLEAGGYTTASAVPSTLLTTALTDVDGLVGRVLTELDAKLLMDSTLVILTAKHGQAPIDRTQLHTRATNPLTFVQETVPGVDSVFASVKNPNTGLAPSVGGHLQVGDVGLLWLQTKDQTSTNVSTILSNLGSAPNELSMAANTLPAGSIFSTNVPLSTELSGVFGDPTVANTLAAARAPNAFIQPNLGTIYTGNGNIIAAHGGGTLDDIRVPIVISSTAIGGPLAVGEPVHTTQLAVTILDGLKLKPANLTAAVAEGTKPLPALSF